MFSTRDKILRASILLFADRGYDDVSMRDIAAETGIQAASIYNHFPSKQDILRSIHDFFVEQHRQSAPSVENLLLLAETEPPHQVLAKMGFHYPPDIQELMSAALVIASKGIKGKDDLGNEQFIQKFLFDSSMNLIIPLVNRMIALGKVEPLDVKVFAHLLTYYAFSAAVLAPTTMGIDLEQYYNGLSMILSLVKPVENQINVS